MGAVPRVVIGLLVLLAGTVGVSAENDDAALQAFTKTPFYKGLINRALGVLPPEIFRRCPGLVSESSHVSVLKPVVFAASGFPNRGAWRQSFPVKGCGNDTTLNFFFQATDDGKINTVAAFPGNTVADLTLQRDALRFAETGAALRNPSCSAFTVINTRFEGFGTQDPPQPDPGLGHGSRPWWETWTLSGCSHTYDVVLDFNPDQTGTRIVQPTNRVVEH